MQDITKLMVNKYRLKKLRYDFMGYFFVSPTELSYHHIVEKKDGGEETVENGAILVRKTSHDYIHIIKAFDLNIFRKITEELIKENRSGRIDMENLKVINELLLTFEEKHKEDTFKDGSLIIRDEYKKRVLTNNNLLL